VGKNIVVAIDGSAGSGKSTLGKRLAKRLGIPYIDSGAFYRAVGIIAKQRRYNFGDTGAIADLAGAIDIQLLESESGQQVLADGEDVSKAVRTPEGSRVASVVAKIPAVRQAVTAQLRQLVAAGGVMEGRDIGTVVLPDAPVKFFLEADLTVRAARRKKDHDQLGVKEEQSKTQDAMAERDKTDETRAVAPLKPADDAIVIDTSLKTLDELEILMVEACTHIQ
jgi:cytidylate kinase